MSLTAHPLAALAAAFSLPALLSALTTFLVRAKANDLGLLDEPDGTRRKHERPVPRLGGVAIMVTTLVTATALFLVDPGLLTPLGSPTLLLALLGTSVGVWVVGVGDDLMELRPRQKLVLEVLLALAAYAGGIRIEAFPFLGPDALLPPVLSLPLTVLWLVGVTNAFNLIDGSDAVAAGAALFASSSLAFVFLINNHMAGAVVALVLAGSVLGFLVFNFPPASIFLGDSGSLFLGYTLAVLGIVTTHKATTALAVAIPVVTFGLPLLDTSLAILRRFLRGDSIFQPDHGHIHHRLKELGHSPRAVALLMFAASAGFAFLALLLTRPMQPMVVMVFLVAGITLWVGVRRLNIPELVEARALLATGLRRRGRVAANMRLRSTACALSNANTMPAIAEALRTGFEDGEFSRVEVRLTSSPNGSADGSFVKDSSGRWVWRWENAKVIALQGSLSLNFPLRIGGDDTGAALTLVREITADPIGADLWLIAQELRPALERALGRCAVPSAAEVRERALEEVGRH